MWNLWWKWQKVKAEIEFLSGPTIAYLKLNPWLSENSWICAWSRGHHAIGEYRWSDRRGTKLLKCDFSLHSSSTDYMAWHILTKQYSLKTLTKKYFLCSYLKKKNKFFKVKERDNTETVPNIEKRKKRKKEKKRTTVPKTYMGQFLTCRQLRALHHSTMIYRRMLARACEYSWQGGGDTYEGGGNPDDEKTTIQNHSHCLSTTLFSPVKI